MTVLLRFTPIEGESETDPLLFEDVYNNVITGTVQISRNASMRPKKSETGTYYTAVLGRNADEIDVVLTTVIELDNHSRQPVSEEQRAFRHWYRIPVMVDSYIGVVGVLETGRLRYGTFILASSSDSGSDAGLPAGTREEGIAWSSVQLTLKFVQVSGSLTLTELPTPATPAPVGEQG